MIPVCMQNTVFSYFIWDCNILTTYTLCYSALQMCKCGVWTTWLVIIHLYEKYQRNIFMLQQKTHNFEIVFSPFHLCVISCLDSNIKLNQHTFLRCQIISPLLLAHFVDWSSASFFRPQFQVKSLCTKLSLQNHYWKTLYFLSSLPPTFLYSFSTYLMSPDPPITLYLHSVKKL